MRHTETRSTGLKGQPPFYAYQSDGYYQFQLIAVTEGTLYLEDAYEKVAVTLGSAAILPVDSAFRLSTTDKAYRGIFFLDTNPTLKAFRGKASSVLLPPPLRAMVELIETEARTPQVGSRDILQGLGITLAWQALRLNQQTQNHPSGYGHHCAERAREALDLALYSNLTARDVLANMDLSYRQISRYFTKVFGVAPKQYLLQMKIREATRLLQQTQIPITAIAYELGFSSSQHFATRFLMVAGTTPSHARASGNNEKSGNSVTPASSEAENASPL